MVKGIKVDLGGREYVVPSLTLDQVEGFLADGTLDRVPMNGPTYLAKPDSRWPLFQVVHAALSRNYPELTVDALRGLLDLNDVEVVVRAVMGASGLTARADQGEAVRP